VSARPLLPSLIALAMFSSCSDEVEGPPPPCYNCNCTVVSDCPPPNDCNIASCQNQGCSLEPLASGRSCGDDAGVCDGDGRCVLTSLDWQALPGSDAPSARRMHSAVWTGDEMIVWGGRIDAMPNVTATGARYDPASDSWSSLSDAGAPAARHSHVAVWTGDEMIVWGGFGASSFLNDGGIYSPATDSWRPMTTDMTVTARTRHTAVWTGDEMIVFGGLNDVTPQAGGWRYDPAADSWQVLPADGAPSARMAHAAVWTGADMIVWGGTNTFDWLATGAHYEPSGDSWTMDTPSDGVAGFRESASHVWTGTAMLIWGGWNGGPNLDDGAIYEPTAGWMPMADDDAPSARQRHTTVWTGSELVVWGGCGGEVCADLRDDGGRYTPPAAGASSGATDRWFAIESSSTLDARQEHSMVWTGSEIIVWGGLGGAGSPLADGARAGL
jgi:hypothetical protein